MSTTIVYNDIPLGFIRTLQIAQEAVYDPSESDYLYTKINIKVESLLNRDIIPPALNGGAETPAQTMARIRPMLMMQCQQLIFSVGGETLFSSPLDDQQEDVKHGPKPMYCNIMRIDGTSTMHIEYCIETYVYDQNCADNSNPYISNRWKESQTVDEHGYTIRTIEGKVFFRGNLIDGKKLTQQRTAPDSYRGVLLPPNIPIPNGFKRTEFKVTVPEDGLGLEYTVTDVEQYTLPPAGLTKFECVYTATSTKGAVWNDRASARGWGNALFPKAQMLVILISMCQQAFNAQTLVKATGKTLKNAVLTYHLHENYFEITITRMLSGVSNTANAFNAANIGSLNKMNYINGVRITDPSQWAKQVGTRGTANIGMVAFQRYLNQCVLPSTVVLSTPTGA